MAEVRLAYGTDGLVVDFPSEQTTVVTPKAAERAADPAAVLRRALRSPVAGPPLRDIVRPGQQADPLEGHLPAEGLVAAEPHHARAAPTDLTLERVPACDHECPWV